jgi:hypothetical protein
MKFEIINSTTNRTFCLGGLTTNLTKDYSEKAFTGNSRFPIRRCFGSAEKITVKAFLFGDFMPTRNTRGQFVKGSTSKELFEGFGIWYDKKGYPTICVNGKDTKLHLYVWERVNGKKPQGYDIHHKDHNKANYNLDNLELLSYSDHQKVHAGWAKENGIWTKKPCKDCKELLPLDAFYPRKGLTPSNRCIECSSLWFKSKLSSDFSYRERKRLYLKDYYQKNKTVILQKQKEAWANRCKS